MDDTLLPHIVLTLSTLLLSLLILFYFPRILGRLLSFIITAYTWSKYRIEVRIDSLSISIVGGHVLFKKFSCSNENFIIKAVHGKLTFRYWVNDLLSTKEREQQIYKIAIEIDGIEVYYHNYTQTYNWIQETFYSNVDKNDLDGAYNETVDDTMSVKALKAIQETSMPYLGKLLPMEIKTTGQGAIFIGHPKASIFLLTTFSECHGNYLTTTCKNPLDSYKNVLNFTFRNVQSRLFDNPFLATKPFFAPLYCSRDTRATQSTEATENQSVHQKFNIEKLVQTLKKAWRMFVYWVKFSWSREKASFDTIWTHYQNPPQSITTDWKADDMMYAMTMIKKKYPMLNIPEDMRYDADNLNWTGLGRYKDGHVLLKEMIEQEEYAKVEQLLSVGEVQIIYQYDVPGSVPYNKDDPSQPEYYYDIIFKDQAKLSYGPYILKHIYPLINFYFPFVYLDLVQPLERKRTWDYIIVQVRFEKGFSLDITHREPSKNSHLITQMRSDPALANITADQVIRSMISAFDTRKKDHHPTLPEYLTRQPAQWTLTTTDATNVCIKVPQQSDPKHGYKVNLQCLLSGESFFALTKHSCTILVPSEVFHFVSPIQIDLSISVPVIWSQLRIWNWEIQLGHHVDLYPLARHIDIWTDLFSDWETCSRQAMEKWYHIIYDDRKPDTCETKSGDADTSDYSSDSSSNSLNKKIKSKIYTFQDYERHFFVPYDTKYHIVMKSGVIHFHVNEFNVINQFKDKEHSSFFNLSFKEVDIRWSSLYDIPFPLHLYTPFNICFTNGVDLYLELQDCDTNHVLYTTDGSISNSISILKTTDEFVFTGNLDSMLKQDPNTCTDTLHLHIYTKDVQLLLLGITIKYWDIFLENYFGLDCEILPFGEYKERILQKSLVDDPEEAILSFFKQYHEYRISSGKNLLYFHTQFICNNILARCSPCLYYNPAIELVNINIGSFKLDFVNSFRYSRLIFNISNIRIFPETGTKTEYVYIDDMKISLMRTRDEIYGSMDSERLCVWLNNQIDIVLTIFSLFKLYSCFKSLIFGIKDVDNALIPPRPTIKDYRNASNIRTIAEYHIDAPIHALLIQPPVGLLSVIVDKHVYFGDSIYLPRISCHLYHVTCNELYLICSLEIDEICYNLKDKVESPNLDDFDCTCPDDYTLQGDSIDIPDINYDKESLLKEFLSLFHNNLDDPIHSFGKGELSISVEKSSKYLPGAFRIKHPQRIFGDTRSTSNTPRQSSNSISIRCILMAIAPSMILYSCMITEPIIKGLSKSDWWNLYILDRLNLSYRKTLKTLDTETFHHSFKSTNTDMKKESSLEIYADQINFIIKVEDERDSILTKISLYPVEILLDIYHDSMENSLKEIHPTVFRWIQNVVSIDPLRMPIGTIRYSGSCYIKTIQVHVDMLEPVISMLLEDVNVALQHIHKPDLIDIIKSRPVWIEQLKIKDKSKYILWKRIMYDTYYTMYHQSKMDATISTKDSKASFTPTLTLTPFTFKGNENVLELLNNNLICLSRGFNECIQRHFSINMMEFHRKLLNSLSTVALESTHIQDPIFISRPSDLWRLCRPSSDAGWKLLFRLYSLVTRMGNQSMSEFDMLSTILDSPLNTWRSWELGTLEQCRLLKFLYPEHYLPPISHLDIRDSMFISSRNMDSDSSEEEPEYGTETKSHFMNLNCAVNSQSEVFLGQKGSRLVLPMMRYSLTMLSYTNNSSKQHALYFDEPELKMNLDHVFMNTILRQFFSFDSIERKSRSIFGVDTLSKTSLLVVVPSVTCISRIQCSRIFLTCKLYSEDIKFFICNTSGKYSSNNSILSCSNFDLHLTEEEGSIQTFIGQLGIEMLYSGSFMSQIPEDLYDKIAVHINTVALCLNIRWNELISKDYASTSLLKIQEIMKEGSTNTLVHLDYLHVSLPYPINSIISEHERFELVLDNLSYSEKFIYLHSGRASLVSDTRMDLPECLIFSIPKILSLTSTRKITFVDFVDSPIHLAMPLIQECALLYLNVVETLESVLVPLYRTNVNDLLKYSILLYHLGVRLDDKLGLSLLCLQLHINLDPKPKNTESFSPHLLSIKSKRKTLKDASEAKYEYWLKSIQDVLLSINRIQCFLPSSHDRSTADQDTEQTILFDACLRTFSTKPKKLDISFPNFKAILAPEVWVELCHKYLTIWGRDIKPILSPDPKTNPELDTEIKSPSITINIEEEAEKGLWRQVLIHYPLIEWKLSNFQLVQIFGSSKMNKVIFASLAQICGTARLNLEEPTSSDMGSYFLELLSATHLDLLWVQGEDELLRVKVPKLHGAVKQKKFISSYINRDSLSNIWQLYCILDQPFTIILHRSKWHLIQPPDLSKTESRRNTSMIFLAKLDVPFGGLCCFNEDDQLGNDDGSDMLLTSFSVPSMTFTVDMMNYIVDVHCYIHEHFSTQSTGDDSESPVVLTLTPKLLEFFSPLLGREKSTKMNVVSPSGSDISLVIHVPSSPFRICLSCDPDSETTALKVLGHIECTGPCGFHLLTSSETRNMFVWIDKISLSIRHIYAPEDCFYVSIQGMKCTSDIMMTVEHISAGIHLRYLQDLFIFLDYWTPDWLGQIQLNNTSSTPLHIKSIQIRMDASQVIGNVLFISNELKYRKGVVIPFYGTHDVISCQSILLSSQGKLSTLIDFRVLDVLINESKHHIAGVSWIDVKFEQPQSQIMTSVGQIAANTVGQQYSSDLILLAHYVGIFISDQWKVDMEWSVDVTWESCVTVLSSKTIPILHGFVRKLETLIEERRSLAKEALSKRQYITPKNSAVYLEYSVKRCYVHGNESSLYLFPTHISTDTIILMSYAKDITLSFSKTMSVTTLQLEKEDMDTIAHVLKPLGGMNAEGLCFEWSDMLVQVRKLEVYKVSWNAPLRRLISIAVPSISIAPMTQIGVMQWIDILDRNDWVMEKRKILGVDSTCSLLMEVYDPKSSTFHAPDVMFYKLTTEFGGPIDLSLHLGMYKFVKELFSEYNHQLAVISGTGLNKGAYETYTFVALVPVHVEPQLKLMAEATPKLERILEWFSLGHERLEVIDKTGSETETTTKVTGTVRSDRKDVMAVIIYKSVLNNIDRTLEYLKALYDH